MAKTEIQYMTADEVLDLMKDEIFNNAPTRRGMWGEYHCIPDKTLIQVRVHYPGNPQGEWHTMRVNGKVLLHKRGC